MMITFDSSSSDQTHTILFVSEFSVRGTSGHSAMPKGIAFSVPQAKLNVRLICPGTTIIHFPFRFTERGQLWSGQRSNLGGVKLTKSIKRPTQNSRAVGRMLHAVHWTYGQTIGSPNFSCLGHVRVPSVGSFFIAFSLCSTIFAQAFALNYLFAVGFHSSCDIGRLALAPFWTLAGTLARR